MSLQIFTELLDPEIFEKEYICGPVSEKARGEYPEGSYRFLYTKRKLISQVEFEVWILE